TTSQIFLDGCFMRSENYSFFDEYAGPGDKAICGNKTRTNLSFQAAAKVNESAYVLANFWKSLNSSSCKNTEVLRKMGKHTGISSECAVPTDSRDSILIQKQKSINAQVVIGTPGTIKKWISFKKLNLTRLTILVFDEADQMHAEERAKALEVIQYLKKKYHEGKCNVAIVDDGKLDTESDSDEFWVLFGGFAPIGKKVVSDEDIIPETTPAQLF
ncbi:hypothetical protein S83_035800, partial [Arachis hypogaea]